MAVASIDHYTVLTNDLDATKRFYCEFLGLSDGPRPPFNFPGAWLYAGNQPVVHVVAGRPFSKDTGTGGVDHVAFMAKGDPDAMIKRLEKRGPQAVLAHRPGHQDPPGLLPRPERRADRAQLSDDLSGRPASASFSCAMRSRSRMALATENRTATSHRSNTSGNTAISPATMT